MRIRCAGPVGRRLVNFAQRVPRNDLLVWTANRAPQIRFDCAEGAPVRCGVRAHAQTGGSARHLEKPAGEFSQYADIVLFVQRITRYRGKHVSDRGRPAACVPTHGGDVDVEIVA